MEQVHVGIDGVAVINLINQRIADVLLHMEVAEYPCGVMPFVGLLVAPPGRHQLVKGSCNLVKVAL